MRFCRLICANLKIDKIAMKFARARSGKNGGRAIMWLCSCQDIENASVFVSVRMQSWHRVMEEGADGWIVGGGEEGRGCCNDWLSAGRLGQSSSMKQRTQLMHKLLVEELKCKQADWRTDAKCGNCYCDFRQFRQFRNFNCFWLYCCERKLNNIPDYIVN